MDNETISIEVVINSLDWLVNGSHELVLGTERNLSNRRCALLEAINVDTGEERGTDNRKLSWVSNLSVATAILAQNTVTTQYSTSHRSPKIRISVS